MFQIPEGSNFYPMAELNFNGWKQAPAQLKTEKPTVFNRTDEINAQSLEGFAEDHAFAFNFRMFKVPENDAGIQAIVVPAKQVHAI